MRTNENFQMVVNESDLMNILYTNGMPGNIIVEVSDWVTKFKETCKYYELDEDIDWDYESTEQTETYLEHCVNNWFLPESYAELDIKAFVTQKCQTTEELHRVESELKEFEKRGMLNILRWLKYFVDTMTANNLIWGVGRGSSVSSYVLFLIGVHKVDSMKYDLDIHEFLK